MKNKKIIAAIFSLACFMFVLTGCGGNEKDSAATSEPATSASTTDAGHDAKADKDGQEVSLADWAGTWNNIGAYLDEAEFAPAFEKLAKEEGKDVDAAKAAYKEKRKCDFNAMVIDGDKVTFLDGFKDKDGKEVASAEYKFDSTHTTKLGEHELHWTAFKATDANAKYPVLLMMPVNTEEPLKHFHLRYGNDVKELLAVEGWFPAMIAPDATTEQISGEIAE